MGTRAAQRVWRAPVHSPFRAWLGDCSIGAQTASTFLPLQLKCGGSDFGYDLVLSGADTPVLHGERGYSQKSDSGSASAYYSYPQLSASGELWIDDARQQVTGSAWYDHEWTSGVLAGDQVGWDWFSLRLSDGGASDAVQHPPPALAASPHRGAAAGSSPMAACAHSRGRSGSRAEWSLEQPAQRCALAVALDTVVAVARPGNWTLFRRKTRRNLMALCAIGKAL